MEQNPQQSQKLMKIISYVGFLALIPFFSDKNETVQFHARQGMVLFGAWVIGVIIDRFAYGLAQIIYLAVSVFSIWGIINVWQNKETRLPVVAYIADKIFKK